MNLKFAVLCILAIGSSNTLAQTASPSPVASPSASPGTPAAIDPAKEKDIRRLLEVAGTKDRMVTVMDGMEKSIRPLMEKALPPGDYRDQLVAAFFAKFHSKLDLQQLLDLAMPLYDKNFSHEEIKALIAFYDSPLGRKTVAVSPSMMNEMMEQGQRLGREVGRTSMEEVLAEHPEFQRAIEEAARNSQQPPNR